MLVLLHKLGLVGFAKTCCPNMLRASFTNEASHVALVLVVFVHLTNGALLLDITSHTLNLGASHKHTQR